VLYVGGPLAGRLLGHRPDSSGSRAGFGAFACARVALNTASKIGVGSPSSRFGRSSPGLLFSSPTRPSFCDGPRFR
jgi:hypothetical protein